MIETSQKAAGCKRVTFHDTEHESRRILQQAAQASGHNEVHAIRTKTGKGSAAKAEGGARETSRFWRLIRGLRVINGIVAVPIMIAMMVVTSTGTRIRSLSLPLWLKFLGRAAAVLMTVPVGMLIWSAVI